MGRSSGFAPGRTPRRGCRIAAVAALLSLAFPLVAARATGAISPVTLAHAPAAVLRVQIPVDVVCATSKGRACASWVTLRVRSGDAPWTAIRRMSGPGMRFDVSALTSRLAIPMPTRTGSVRFSLRARSGNRSVSIPGSTRTGALRYYVTDSMDEVVVPPVPFGDTAEGTVELYLPWGSGRGDAGLAPGVEAATSGPSSFDLLPSGDVILADPVNGRVSVYSNGDLVRETGSQLSPRSDLSVDQDGTAYVATSPTGNADRILVSTIDPTGHPGRVVPIGVAGDIPSELRADGRPSLHVLPDDAWLSVRDPGTETAGMPVEGGGQLLKVVDGDTVRLGTVRDGNVEDAVELRFSQSLGELALAEPDGSHGYWIVVHTGQDQPDPADQYQVVHVDGDRQVTTFAVPHQEFAETMPLSKFRLGPDGDLHAITSSSDGVRILRYDLGGSR
jgi:hypothetical protein